ncbi:hypothetical protein CRI94_16480 [Longibacter salinarum]|uniref:Polymer-forming cytoskeletal protein n=1 Tax=Longibacter salinarum TaxID=1850348 RepID=A0A2A8CTX8_9BACT|nr:hypothetical protein [Longibacter salinarum]PEN11184.1 hypothetical protein CRI94_16480 [Longibacter salinarum]
MNIIDDVCPATVWSKSLRSMLWIVLLLALWTAHPTTPLARAEALDQLRPDTTEHGPFQPVDALTPDRLRMRVGGDMTVAAEEREGAVIVIDGNLVVEGTVEAVVVVNGDATFRRANVGTLVVIDGRADLSDGTVIRNDVHLVASDLGRTDDVAIRGRVQSGLEYPIAHGLLLFGVLVALGGAVAIIGAGLIAAAVAPKKMREMGALITDDVGATVLAGLAVWAGLPLVAGALFATLVGIPIALGILFILLPAAAVIGYIVSGIRLGDYVMARFRGHDEAWHPYRAAASGLVFLLLAGWLPFFGSVVTPIAVFLGSGALALTAWKAIRWPVSSSPSEKQDLAVHEGS